VTISLGVGCCIPSDHIKAKDLIELADTALYQAKANGRNAVVAAMQSLEAPPMPSLPKGA
jgi:diguanylate cyclase (GGDEF)-like protein